MISLLRLILPHNLVNLVRLSGCGGRRFGSMMFVFPSFLFLLSLLFVFIYFSFFFPFFFCSRSSLFSWLLLCFLAFFFLFFLPLFPFLSSLFHQFLALLFLSLFLYSTLSFLLFCFLYFSFTYFLTLHSPPLLSSLLYHLPLPLPSHLLRHLPIILLINSSYSPSSYFSSSSPSLSLTRSSYFARQKPFQYAPQGAPSAKGIIKQMILAISICMSA